MLLPWVLSSPLSSAVAADETATSFRIERTKSFPGPVDYYYMQTRAAAIPGDTPRILMTTQEIEKHGAHGFHDVFQIESRDLGRTWSPSKRIENLRRAKRPDGYEVVIGDLSPQWHA